MARVVLSGARGSAHRGMLTGVGGVVKLYFVNGLDCWGWGKGVRTSMKIEVITQ